MGSFVRLVDSDSRHSRRLVPGGLDIAPLLTYPGCQRVFSFCFVATVNGETKQKNPLAPRVLLTKLEQKIGN